jgi:2-hydroxy-6-oxonona-2,4-dienedioate hydrolase
MTRLVSRYAQVQGWKIHTRTAAGRAGSKGYPVVLVHGLSQSSRYFIPLAECLGQDFPVFAPDFPGYGLSDKPAHTLSVREMADLLAAWMNLMGMAQADLVGNSLGCNVITELALRHPGLVRRAVLAGPGVDIFRRTALQQVGRTLVAAFHERFSLIPRVLFDYALASPRRSLAALRHALNHPIEQRLPLMEMPTLVIRGEKDPIAPQDWIDEVMRLLPRGRLVILPKYGHGVHYSLPGATAQVITAFFHEDM